MEVDDLWWVGVILSIFSAMFGSLGDNLIKLSYTQEDLAEREGQDNTPILKRPLWWIGMLCITVVNTTLTLIAYSFSDASLVIPFGGLHICFNVLFARVLNHEEYTSRQAGFTFIILVGVTVVLVSGNHDTVVYSIDEIQELFQSLGFILLSVLILFLILLQIPLSTLHWSARVRCLTCATLVGTVGSVTQVFAKTMSECISQAISGDAQDIFAHYIPYVAIFITIIAAAVQLFLLNRVLRLYNVFVVVPIVNSTLIILGSLYGAILFKEYERFDVKSIILMPIGILTTGLGVALLAWDHRPEDSSELLTGAPPRFERSETWSGFPSTPITRDHSRTAGAIQDSFSMDAASDEDWRLVHPLVSNSGIRLSNLGRRASSTRSLGTTSFNEEEVVLFPSDQSERRRGSVSYDKQDEELTL